MKNNYTFMHRIDTGSSSVVPPDEQSNQPTADLPEKTQIEFTPERREYLLEAVDGGLEFIIRESLKRNEGNSGVIYAIEISSFSKELTDALRELGLDFGASEKAMKVMKVYYPGDGEREYERHLAAYKMLQTAQGTLDIARVPQPYIFRDIELSEETAEKLCRDSGRLDRPNRAELFLMDYIEGDDLATLTYRKLLEVQPDSEAMLNKYGVRVKAGETVADTLRELDLKTLQLILFKEIGLEQRNDNMLPGSQQEQLLDRRNAKKILRQVGRSSRIKLNPLITTQVRNLLQVLHNNGLAHRDMHPRNVVITGDPFAVEPEAVPAQAYVIDFGSAQSFTGNYLDAREALYISPSGERRPDDDDIISFLTALEQRTEVSRLQGVTLAEYQAGQAESFIKTPAKKKRFEALNESLSKMFEVAAQQRTTAEYMYSQIRVVADAPERKALQFLASLVAIVDQAPDQASKAKAIIENLLDSSVLTTEEKRVLKENLELFEK